MRRDLDRPRVDDRVGERAADPPDGVRRELQAAAMVELLDGADQADGPLLHEIVVGSSTPAIPLRERMDEPQGALDHLSLGREVTTLDALGELDLLGGREEAGVAAAAVRRRTWVAGISRHRREHRTRRTGAGLGATNELTERGRRGLIAP